MKEILIIGCGYLGNVIAADALAKGIKVFATTRSRADVLISKGITPVSCDVTNQDSYPNLPMVDGVVHCVGMDRSAGKSMREVYVDGLAGIATYLQSKNFKGRFVHVSSTSVYGQNEGEVVDEKSPTIPAEGSGGIVLEAENKLRSILPEAIILRFAGIYGPGRLIRGKAILAGEPIVCSPDRYLNLMHVADGAKACLAALSEGKTGETYNASDDEPALRRDFYNHLALLLKAAPPKFILPSIDQPAPPHEGTNRRISNLKLKRELVNALQFPSFREGLENCVNLGAFA
ncbi:MAG: SDR family oxidoreductase [Gemmataceae bacterium]|nr:SDR family oxidoreductase [Gemmataceae bacterium]